MNTATLKNKKGFTLIYTLLIIGVVLTVSTSIFSLMIKELKLSDFGRESIVAYQAGESGAECAYYAVLQGTNFGGSFSVECYGQTFTSIPFTVNFGANGGCATVTVTDANTVIESRGYNTCQNNKIRMERGVRYNL